MHRLIDYPAQGFRVIFLDGQSYSTPEDLVTDLIVKAGELAGDARSIIQKMLGGLRENIDEIEIWKLRLQLRKEVSGRWREEGERAVREVLAAGGMLLLVIDELPILLHKMIRSNRNNDQQNATDLLDWLRFLRTQPEMNQRLRQIVGGSIGLPRIASYIGASHKINDLLQIDVGPFHREEARELATQLFASREVTIDPRTMDAFLDQVGTFLPVFIQIMTSAVATEVKERHTDATPELVHECYEQRALGPEYRICFEDYYERLDRYYTPTEARTAKRILRELALAESPLAKSALLASYLDELGQDGNEPDFDLLLSWLRDNFYVEQMPQDNTVEFKNEWLRDWWRVYHAAGN